MSNTFKADLIGVYDHVNSNTGIEFKGLSFRVAPGKIASIGANDKRDEDGNIVEAIGDKIQKAFNEAKERGVGLLFDIKNAILVEETEELDDGTEVPLPLPSERCLGGPALPARRTWHRKRWVR